MLAPRTRQPIQRWSSAYTTLIQERASGSGRASEVFVITSNRARGEWFEVLIFAKGAEVRYRPGRRDGAEFRRAVTAGELKRLRALVETYDLDTRGDYSSQVEDGWYYIYRHLTPSGLHMFLADNPDQDAKGEPIHEAYMFFDGLLDSGEWTYRFAPSVRVEGLRLEFAHPRWSVAMAWALGGDLRVRLTRPGDGVSYGEELGSSEGVDQDLPDGPTQGWRAVQAGVIGKRVRRPDGFALEPGGWLDPPSLPEDSDYLPDDPLARTMVEGILTHDRQRYVGFRAGKIVVYDLKTRVLSPVEFDGSIHGFRALAPCGENNVLFVERGPDDCIRLLSVYADADGGVATLCEDAGPLPLDQEPCLPLQLASEDRVWAACPVEGERVAMTLVGTWITLFASRFETRTLVEGFAFESDSMWIDATTQRAYVITAERALVSFPLPEKTKR
ncbi:MAG: hypothetical protein JKY65_16220 [Planctomycetes bacterium]|nr:hypothetical protein [Planctomycetota bacterium]